MIFIFYDIFLQLLSVKNQSNAWTILQIFYWNLTMILILIFGNLMDLKVNVDKQV